MFSRSWKCLAMTFGKLVTILKSMLPAADHFFLRHIVTQPAADKTTFHGKETFFWDLRLTDKVIALVRIRILQCHEKSVNQKS